MKRVTLQMIADKLSVSRGLVSKALSNDPAVNDQTRETIWKVAEEMGYRFRTTHKKSAHLGTGNISVMMPRAYLDDMEYWGKVIRGIEKELENHGYSVMLSSIDINLSPKEGLPNSIYDKKIDGAIVMGHLPDSYIKSLVHYNIPLVMVDANLFNPSFDHVLANNFLGAYHATGKLLAAGHRHLAFVGDIESSFSFRERNRGFEEAIHYFNASTNGQATFTTIKGIGVSGSGMYTSDKFTTSLHDHFVLNKLTAPTAMFCANDLCALELLKWLNKNSIHCPEDVSIIGFDNSSVTELMSPKLTTVSVPKAVIGLRAVQMLLNRIANPDHVPELILISTQLIERDSVKTMDRSLDT